MLASEFIEGIVPKELFKMPPPDADFLAKSQYLLEQCHPGSTRMVLRSLSGESAEAEIPWALENRALHGFMHGGCFFTVGDTMTALMCMFFVEKPEERMLTMDASIRYLRPIVNDTVIAKARLHSRKNKQLNFVCDFFNDKGKRSGQAKYRYVLVDTGAA